MRQNVSGCKSNLCSLGIVVQRMLSAARTRQVNMPPQHSLDPQAAPVCLPRSAGSPARSMKGLLVAICLSMFTGFHCSLLPSLVSVATECNRIRKEVGTTFAQVAEDASREMDLR